MRILTPYIVLQNCGFGLLDHYFLKCGSETICIRIILSVCRCLDLISDLLGGRAQESAFQHNHLGILMRPAENCCCGCWMLASGSILGSPDLSQLWDSNPLIPFPSIHVYQHLILFQNPPPAPYCHIISPMPEILTSTQEILAKLFLLWLKSRYYSGGIGSFWVARSHCLTIH